VNHYRGTGRDRGRTRTVPGGGGGDGGVKDRGGDAPARVRSGVLLIDAFNVLHAQWCLPREERGLDVPGLVRLIGRSRHAGRRARIVCDGRPGPQWARGALLETHCGMTWTRVGRAEVVFSGRGREADDVIEEVLERSRGLAILVVSSDRRLVRAAGVAGADRIGNGAFLKQLSADARARRGEPAPAFVADVPLDHYSVVHWMREFGFEPPGAEPAARAAPEPAREAPKPEEPGGDAPARKTGGGRSPAGIGERLGIELPPVSEVVEVPDPGPTPDPVEREALDPVLGDAFEEWCGRLDPADLDMERWITGVDRLDRG